MDLFTFVKESLPILDVISEYVQVKPMGNYHKGSCPFHSEKDASFTVSPYKQIFYCFGCQASGDVIGFIAKIENMSQLEAAKYLVDRHGLEVPESVDMSNFKNISATEKERYYNVYQKVTEWSHEQLMKSKPAKKYLLDRGFSEQQLKFFQVGFFPSGIRNLNRFAKAMAEQKILLKDLIECHIVMEGKLLYSPFEERILFPISDHLGRYCGFGGRIFRKEDERAKYYNSKESDFFSKGKLIFGLDKAKKEIQEKEHVFLVEGYMDCLAMVQHGYSNTVATLGTACTLDHLKLLSRHADTLFLLFDGDKAGQQAILRIAQLCWQVNLDVKVVVLPHGQDPDSFLHNKGDLSQLVEQSCDIFTFFIKSMLGDDFLQRPLPKKMDAAKKVVELIAVIPDAFKRDLLLHQAASAMHMSFQSVRNFMMKRYRDMQRNKTTANIRKAASKEEAAVQHANNEEESDSLEEKIFSVILNTLVRTGTLLAVESELIPYFSPRIQALLKKLYSLAGKGIKSSEFFTSYMNVLAEEESLFASRVSIEYDVTMEKEEFDKLVFLFCSNNWKDIARAIKKEMLEAKLEGDQAKLQELFGKFARLKEKFLHRGLYERS